VTRSTSTVFKILTWNLIHMFGMKCRCAWHIFRVDQSIIFFWGHDVTKLCYANFYTYYVNSFQDINWNFKHIFVSTASFFFHLVQSIIFWKGAWFNKILWSELLLQFLRYWLETLYMSSAWSVDVRDIFFNEDQSIMFCRGHDLTKSCYAYFNSFQYIDLKLKLYVLHDVRM
jgi:hypothetical protein